LAINPNKKRLGMLAKARGGKPSPAKHRLDGI